LCRDIVVTSSTGSTLQTDLLTFLREVLLGKRLGTLEDELALILLGLEKIMSAYTQTANIEKEWRKKEKISVPKDG